MPGRTQTLNFFNVGDSLRLVDLPVCTHSQGCCVWAHATSPSLPHAAHTPRLPGAGYAEACARGPNKKEKGKTQIRKNKNQNKKK
jgi:hypothetical protein